MGTATTTRPVPCCRRAWTAAYIVAPVASPSSTRIAVRRRSSLFNQLDNSPQTEALSVLHGMMPDIYELCAALDGLPSKTRKICEVLTGAVWWGPRCSGHRETHLSGSVGQLSPYSRCTTAIDRGHFPAVLHQAPRTGSAPRTAAPQQVPLL